MKEIDSIREIVDMYDNFIIDQWGVMHDGNKGYSCALKAIEYLEKKNKNLIIISNSSKRKHSSINKLPNLGFKKNSFSEVITSGEMIWRTIDQLSLKNLKKKKCFHIYDKSKKDGLDFRKDLKNIFFTEDISEADFILACTPYDNSQPIDYVPLLDKALEKNLIMYCANPDFETVEKNKTKNAFCMGIIAELYKKIGGKVIIQGKPEIDIYNESTKNIKIDKSKTIAIGDSLFHDIKGANNFNIDSILVKSGIHLNLTNINKIIKNHQIVPKYLINNFSI